MECRSEGGYFGPKTQTQHLQLASKDERYEEVPANNTTTRTAPINTRTAQRKQPTQPTQHNADDPTTSVCCVEVGLDISLHLFFVEVRSVITALKVVEEVQEGTAGD